MADSPVCQGRAAKKMKLVGRDFCGKIPKVFLDGENNIVKMEFHIHDFANRKEKRGEQFFTGIIKADDQFWLLSIYPQGGSTSNTDDEYVSIYLYYNGTNTETDPVVAKARIRTKTDSVSLAKYEFSMKNNNIGRQDFGKRKDIIENDCNEAGTLTIIVELQVATEKKSVWYPQLTFCDTNDIGIQLYNSNNETSSDITFIIGASKKEFFGHKCVLAVRSRVWYELLLAELSSSNKSNNNCIVVLADIDEQVFEVILRFLYTGEVPTFNKDNDNDNDNDEETIKSILLAANRFGVTELKLYAESILVEKFLVSSKAAAFLLFADSYSCGLLKEKSMDMYASNSKEVMESHEDWMQLKESNDLLVELLVYATSDRKRYSSIVDDDGNGTIEDANGFDVTSLRERLQKVNLDVDGSREILVQRWKEYLLVNNNNNNNEITAL